MARQVRSAGGFEALEFDFIGIAGALDVLGELRWLAPKRGMRQAAAGPCACRAKRSRRRKEAGGRWAENAVRSS